MVGNFRIFYLFVIFNISCSPKVGLGEEIVQENFDVFLQDIPVSLIQENRSGNLPIVVYDSVTTNSFIRDYCEDECFEKINVEGYNINKETAYDNFIIRSIPTVKREYKVLLIKDYRSIKSDKHISLSFYNFYVSERDGKAFILVDKYEAQNKWGKTEVFFFSRDKNKWRFDKKVLLLNG